MIVEAPTKKRERGMIREGKDGGYEMRIRFRDGHRPWLPLPKGLSEKQARAHAVAFQKRARTMDSPPLRRAVKVARPAHGETVRAWFKRWTPVRKGRGLTSVGVDPGRANAHIFGVDIDGTAFGDLPIAHVSTDDVETVRDDMDRKIHNGETSWKTIENAWTLLRAIFRDARRHKDRSLRAREDDPTVGVEAPDRGAKKAKQFLYPSEFLALMNCERVPARYRRRYALAIYLYVRISELGLLDIENADLEHRAVTIEKALQADGTIGPPKNGHSRTIPIEPAILPLLRAIADEQKTGPLIKITQKANASGILREYLRKAGVERRELHVRTRTSVPISFHDLRATGLTWCAVRGDDPLKIKQRAGHKSLATTEVYIRTAEALREGFGEPFPALPESVISGRAPDLLRTR